MTEQSANWRLLTIITNADRRKKVEDIMSRHCSQACLSLNAKGTTHLTWLHQLGIKNSAKMHFEFLLAPEREKELLDIFCKELNLEVPGHGIAFSTEVLYHVSTRGKLDQDEFHAFCHGVRQVEENNNMYKKICVIVDLGQADDVVDAARSAGARGGTILHGHGSATEEHATLFGFQIVPEKEMVIILVPNDILEGVVLAINDKLALDGIGNGILYIQPVLATKGLVEHNFDV